MSEIQNGQIPKIPVSGRQVIDTPIPRGLTRSNTRPRSPPHLRPIPRIPTIVNEGPRVDTEALREILQSKKPETPSMEPLIPVTEMITPEERPSSPFDETRVTANGTEITIDPIKTPADDVLITPAPPNIVPGTQKQYVPSPPSSPRNSPRTIQEEVPVKRDQRNGIPSPRITRVKTPPSSPIRIKIATPNNPSSGNPNNPSQPDNTNVVTEFLKQDKTVEQKVKTDLPIANAVLESYLKKKRDKIPNYSAMSPEEQEQIRTLFRNKRMRVLKDWPNFDIPPIRDDEKLEIVHARDDMFIRFIKIRRSVEEWTSWMIVIFAAIELVFTSLKIGLDISGFAEMQIKSISRYDSLLFELSEFYLNDDTEATPGGWSIETRLIFFVCLNLLSFIVLKILGKFLGEGTAEKISNYMVEAFNKNRHSSYNPMNGDQEKIGGEEIPGEQQNGFDMSSVIRGLGSVFTEFQKNNRNNQAQNNKRDKPNYNG